MDSEETGEVAVETAVAADPREPDADPVSSGACCPECEARSAAQAEELVYAIGKLDVRFPSIGIEREFQQRKARLGRASEAGASRGSQIREVLEENRHLATRMCYILTVGGVPAYVVAPTSSSQRDDIFDAIAHAAHTNHWSVLIGRRGPMAGPGVCGGLLAPIVACDQLYSFAIEEWQATLESQLRPALESRKIAKKTFTTVAQEVFGQIVHSTENLGATDVHRALNYLLLQHPGIFLAAAERSGKQTLERIETRLIRGLGTRRVVAVILVFVDLATGVAERLFSRVDVTEEWPFISEGIEGDRPGLGLMPFIENPLLSVGY
jgi:hypothetical protein